MSIKLNECKVWVLAPYLISGKETIEYYYDYSQSIAEYKRAFETLSITWQWQAVTMENYKIVIDQIAQSNEHKNQLVFNLCDGDEIHLTPGISVIHYLEEKGICYTGSDAYFFGITTSKITMKQAFDCYAVPTASWKSITKHMVDVEPIFKQLGSPLILKPAVSGGSMGIGIKNVVENAVDCLKQLNNMFQGYRGWALTEEGVIAESFINGPEYTVFIRGNYHDKKEARIYSPVERVFHDSLPEKEKILSYDRLWEIYEEETAMPNNEFFYKYQLPDISLHKPLQKIAWDAFASCKGTGYARIDIRMDLKTKKLFVLEVNAQCGISEDEDYTSIGAILKLSDSSFSELVKSILEDAISSTTKHSA